MQRTHVHKVKGDNNNLVLYINLRCRIVKVIVKVIFWKISLFFKNSDTTCPRICLYEPNFDHNFIDFTFYPI